MIETQHPNLPITRDGHIATVSFSRPEARNAFNLSMWQGLQATMEALSADDDLRCVILRGAGSEAFSAGADIKGFETERGTAEAEALYARIFHSSMQSIRLCRHPVIAAIEGACLGGGAGIATMCDFRVGGAGIRLGITACKLSLWYPYAEIAPVIAMVGTAVATEMLIEGRIFDGHEAYAKGLLSCVVADGAVQAEAIALARRVADGAPLAARFHKAAIRRLGEDTPITEAEVLAASGFALTEDFQGAVQAFKARRKPEWRGR